MDIDGIGKDLETLEMMNWENRIQDRNEWRTMERRRNFKKQFFLTISVFRNYIRTNAIYIL